MTDILRTTLNWFKKCVPVPAPKNLNTQLGCHCEEINEMLIEIEIKDPEGAQLLKDAANTMHRLGNYLKANGNAVIIKDREAYLNAICDQIVTATGCAHMAGMLVISAMDEVNRELYSKFDVNGDPIFNENKKIMKGPFYQVADLSRFV